MWPFSSLGPAACSSPRAGSSSGGFACTALSTWNPFTSSVPRGTAHPSARLRAAAVSSGEPQTCFPVPRVSQALGSASPAPAPFTPTMRRVRPGPREEGTASPSAASRGRSVARQGGRLRRSVQTAGRRAKGCGGQRDRSPYLFPSRLAPRPTLCLVHMTENLEKWRGRVKAAGVVASGAADGDPALRLSRPQDCPVPAGRSLLLVCGCGRQGSAWQPAAWAARGL